MKIRCSNEHLIFRKIGVWQNVEGSQINKNCISIVCYVGYYIFWIKLPGFFVYYPYNSLVQSNVPYLQTYFKFIFCITETYFWPCVFLHLLHANKVVFLHGSIYLQKQKEVFSSKARCVVRDSKSEHLVKSWCTETACQQTCCSDKRTWPLPRVTQASPVDIT